MIQRPRISAHKIEEKDPKTQRDIIGTLQSCNLENRQIVKPYQSLEKINVSSYLTHNHVRIPHSVTKRSSHVILTKWS
jgi:hypothetical protein